MQCFKGVHYNLTHPQRRIWYIDRINSGSPFNNIGGCLKINGNINVEKLKQSINIVIMNNEGLRLRFSENEGKPVQYINAYREQNIEFINFSDYENSRAEHKKWCEDIFKTSFQIENNQLYYFAIYKISENEYGLLLKIHHIIADGWSISLIEKEICEVYSKLLNGDTISLGKNYSYIEYIKEEIEYVNSRKYFENKNFWAEMFKNLPEQFLYSTSSNLEGKRQIYNINTDLSKEVKAFIQDKKCSLNTFFIAILNIYLNKITYEKDIVLGTPIFNRCGKKQKNTIGMFTSTLPFKFHLDVEMKVGDLIKSISRELRTCFVNQRYPYDLLINDLKESLQENDSLYKMCVNYYNYQFINKMGDIAVEAEEYYCGSQSYSLQLTVKEWQEDKIVLNVDYKISEYSEQQIQVMYKAIINIIKQILSNRNVTIKNIQLIDDEEINHKLYELNSTNSNYPLKTVYELFEIQTEKTPYKIALEFKDREITYNELNEKSNQLANFLRQHGVHKESIVGIMASRSVELVVSILAVLKSGGSYLPIDPVYPIERINYMLQDSKATILLTNLNLCDEKNFDVNVVNVNQIDLVSFSKENLIKESGLVNLAYIIYTSGSTGKPKGVMIGHRGLTNYICWAKKMYMKEEEEVMPLYSSISFDLTVTSIFTPLISGNRVLIYDNDDNEFVLYKILRENRATVVKLTPAHLTLLKGMNNRNSIIKRFIVGGEDLKVTLARDIYNSFGKKVEILNEYGPTETVVGCMIYRYCEETDKGISVPIGHPADNVQIYILDNDFNVVPTGVEGEIYISGDGVAKGYINREDLTKEKFVANPFIRGTRMYRTGDRAKYLSNGKIEYIGRNDHQIKIRGHRIEVGEIERCLLENKNIKDVTVYIKKDKCGNDLLNAYLVTNGTIYETQIKNWLLKFLPQYMIPSRFIFMDKLPLTINGKVDYGALPDPIVDKKEFIQYRKHTEEELVKVMEEVLQIDKISMNDNYFQLGGDSIKAIQISSKLKSIGLNIKVKDILTQDSIEEIATNIEVDKTDKIKSQALCEGYVELTPIHNWFFSRKLYNENVYSQYVFFESKEKLDSINVNIVINRLIEHHDVLRINYDRKNKRLFYNNEHLKQKYSTKSIDLPKMFDNKCDINSLIKESNIDFNIEKSLLFDVTLFNFKNGRQAILFIAHHIIVDGISWRIILDDFTNLMNQINNNCIKELPRKTSSFKEWSEKLYEYGKNDFQEEKRYLESIIENGVIYPMDFNNGEDTVKTSAIMSRQVDESITMELIKKINEIYSINFNDALIIALVLTINKITHNENIVLELERHGREDISDSIDVSRTVGWFTNIFPMKFNVLNKDIGDNIKSLKEQLRGLRNNGVNLSIFSYLNSEISRCDGKCIRFNYLGDFDNIINNNLIDTSKIKLGLYSDENNSLTALFDITAMIINKKLKLDIQFSINRFKNSTVSYLLDKYIETLKLMLDICGDKASKEFTPTDFDAANISQEDLDSLFN